MVIIKLAPRPAKSVARVTINAITLEYADKESIDRAEHYAGEYDDREREPQRAAAEDHLSGDGSGEETSQSQRKDLSLLSTTRRSFPWRQWRETMIESEC
ncbi:MAG: hypothetical protein WKF84_05890 [Pyrinomonadaceae bacterium]